MLDAATLPGITGEFVVHVVEGLVLAFVGYLGLKTQNVVLTISVKQMEIKEELVEKQNEMREDMDKKHSENSQAIAVHAAADEQQFRNIAGAIARFDNKLDRLNGK